MAESVVTAEAEADYQRFRPLFEDALDPAYYPIEWLDREVASGKILLLHKADSAILITVKQYPSGLKELHGMLAVGNLLTIRQDLIPQALGFGRYLGCQVAAIESRPGWSRIMRSDGWQLHQQKLVIDL